MDKSEKYIEYLKGGFYKCLCLFEEKNDGLSQYIDNLSYEIYGLQYLVNNTECVITLLSVLEHFYDDSLFPEPDITVIRKQVFKCMDVIDKLFEVGDDG